MSAAANVFPSFPRFSLSALPTPLERAPRFEEALRAEGAAPPRIWLKRDDLLSLGLGGNKIRNLEFIIGQALDAGATDIITMGREQSNHCRLTAAACARAGLRCHLVLMDVPPPRATGNLLLDGLFGADVRFTGTTDRADRERVTREIAAEVERAGGRPHIVGVGGSDVRGAVGHAFAAAELLDQCDAIGLRPAAVVVATATAGTQAGMLAGLALLASDVPVFGYAVSKDAVETSSDVIRIANDVARQIGARPVPSSAVHVDDSARGAGYGIPSAAGQAAVELLARTEGVLVDPVYTAKALAGLRTAIAGGRFSPRADVVFIHTGGSVALFADLPATSM